MLRYIWSKSLRDYRVAIIGWGIGVGLLELSLFASASPAITEAYVTIAPSVRFIGDAFAVNTPEGYVTLRGMELTIPTLISIWAILAGSRLVRGEEDNGIMDILLAKPRSRVRLVSEKISALVIALILIALVNTMGALTGESILKMNVNFGRALLANLNVSLLAFFFGTLANFLGQFTTRKTTAAGLTGGLLVLAFLLDGIGRVIEGTGVNYFSPFYYYNLNRPLIPGFRNTPSAAFLLLGFSLLFTGLGMLFFTRRDSGGSVFTWQFTYFKRKQNLEDNLQKAERTLSMQTIWLRTLRFHSVATFWWLFGLMLTSTTCVLLIPTMQAPMSKALQKTPSLAKLFSGQDPTTNTGFLSIIPFIFLPPLVVSFALTLALNWAADLEKGSLELILSRPQSRSRLLLERFSAISILALLVTISSWFAIMLGTQIVNLKVDQGNVFAASISMFPLTLVTMGLVFALAGRLRYGAVLGLVTVYLAYAYFIELLKTLLNLPDWILNTSIFSQYGNPLRNGLQWGSFLGMTGVGLILLFWGLYQFKLVDIARKI